VGEPSPKGKRTGAGPSAPGGAAPRLAAASAAATPARPAAGAASGPKHAPPLGKLLDMIKQP